MSINAGNMQGKKVLIVGLGRSGIAATQAMLRLGAEVYIQDNKRQADVDPQLLAYLQGRGVTCFFDEVPPDMHGYDMLILSPGVSPELPFIQEAQAMGTEIIGELEIAYRVGSGNYVAITGTNGKTTTTTLVGEIFKAARRKTYVVGNIGVAVISASLDAEPDAWLITETSSFQLETTRYFKPVVSAILNLTPDHLNRHHSMEAYARAKARVFANQQQDGYLIINGDDPICCKLAADCRATVVPFSRTRELDFGAFMREDCIYIRDRDGREAPICRREEQKLIGDHNLENVLAASAISYFAGIDPETIGAAVRAFRGVAHRIEFCGCVEGVNYYNDSKGTNIDAAVTALRAIGERILLIAGGDGKGQDFAPFVRAFGDKVKHLLLLGRDGGQIAAAADRIGFTDYEFCRDMDACVRRAYELAEPGDTVLLSPACASWDMYDNFEQRGDHFKSCVGRL